MNILLNGIVSGTGAWNPVPGSFGPVNASITFSTLFPRKNYQGSFPIKIPGYAMSWLASSSTLSGTSANGGNTAFSEVLSSTPNPNTMNQVGLPSDTALATTITDAAGDTLTLLANTQSFV